jgi:general secretion pathway protein G
MKFLLLSFALMLSETAFGMSTQSRLVAAEADMAGGLKTALDVFALNCGRYPTTTEGFNALINCPTNISGGRWHGPYLEQTPIDPWGTEYVYHYPGIHNTNGFDIYSCGADGRSSSAGDDSDDVNNWDSSSPRGGYYSELSLFDKLRNSRAFGWSLLFFQIVPLCGIARLATSLFSQRVRDSIARHPTAHFIWFVASVIGFLFFLSCFIPRIA